MAFHMVLAGCDHDYRAMSFSMVSTLAPACCICSSPNDQERAATCAPLARCGTATKSGCWPAAELCTSPFPLLYASGFSGFYLPLMIVLWLLILRGIGIELRMHIEGTCGAASSMAASLFQHSAGDFLWRCSGQRGSWRAPE